MLVVNIFFSAENFSRRYMCVCIATAVDFSIQVQMNQWKIVWLPVWINLMLLLEVVLSLVRVVEDRLRRSFEVSRVLVNNCTCCMTKQRLAILSMSLHKRDRFYGKIKTSLMLIWVNKWKMEAVIACCNWVLRSLIYPDNIIGIGSNSFWNLHLGFGLCGLVI